MQPTHLIVNIHCVQLVFYYFFRTIVLCVGQIAVVTEGIDSRKLCSWSKELISVFPTL